MRLRSESKRQEAVKLHDEKLHNLYFSSKIIRAIKSRSVRWVGRVPRVGETGDGNILMRKPKGKKVCVRSRRKHLVLYRTEVGCEVWRCQLAHDSIVCQAFVITVMNRGFFGCCVTVP